MGNQRIVIAKKDIFNLLDENGSKIYKPRELSKILAENRRFWRLTRSTRFIDFVDFLKQSGKLKEVTLTFPSVTEKRFIWGEASFFNIMRTLKPGAYFSHYSAVFFNHLTEQIPKTYYLNLEQPVKRGSTDGNMTQRGIDNAFKNKPRTSNSIAEYLDYRIILLSGKNTGKLGVVDYTLEDGEVIEVTNLERTIIDITVRPMYAGGVYEVLNAYKMAKDLLSVNKMLSYLAQINHAYPYHQAIGFYLERAGYKDSQLELVRTLEKNYDFYLDYGFKDLQYSKEWKLYFPTGL